MTTGYCVAIVGSVLCIMFPNGCVTFGYCMCFPCAEACGTGVGNMSDLYFHTIEYEFVGPSMGVYRYFHSMKYFGLLVVEQFFFRNVNSIPTFRNFVFRSSVLMRFLGTKYAPLLDCITYLTARRASLTCANISALTSGHGPVRS